jgi:hypothetical protein
LCCCVEVLIIDDVSFGVYGNATFVFGFNDWLLAGTLNRLLDDEIFNCSSKRLSDGRVYLCV